MDTKTCLVCQQAQPFFNFYRDKRKRDGHHARCKVCEGASRKLADQKRQGTDVPVVPPPPPRLTPDQQLLYKARSGALLRLVKHHRSEYDTLVYREKMRLQYPGPESRAG